MCVYVYVYVYVCISMLYYLVYCDMFTLAAVVIQCYTFWM